MIQIMIQILQVFKEAIKSKKDTLLFTMTHCL